VVKFRRKHDSQQNRQKVQGLSGQPNTLKKSIMYFENVNFYVFVKHIEVHKMCCYKKSITKQKIRKKFKILGHPIMYHNNMF